MCVQRPISFPFQPLEHGGEEAGPGGPDLAAMVRILGLGKGAINERLR